VQIRNFREEDAPGVKTLIKTILNEEFASRASAYPETDLADISKTYGGQRETFYVIDDKDKIIGTAGIKEDSKTIALLRRLFVHRDYRNRRLGSNLVDKAVLFCKEKGYKHVVFRSTDVMDKANSLLLKKGFKEEEKLDFGQIQILKFVKNI